MEVLWLIARVPLLLMMLVPVITATAAARFHGAEYAESGQAPELRLMFILNGVVGLINVPVGLVASLLFWVWVRPRLARFRRLDGALSDEDWLSTGQHRFTQAVGQYPVSPENAVAGGDGCRRGGDRATALWFYREAIERLHAAYVEQRMATRTPSIEDSRIIMPYLATLRTMRELRRDALADALARQASQRFLAIAQACHSAGHDALIYASALDRLAALSAPR